MAAGKNSPPGNARRHEVVDLFHAAKRACQGCCGLSCEKLPLLAGRFDDGSRAALLRRPSLSACGRDAGSDLLPAGMVLLFSGENRSHANGECLFTLRRASGAGHSQGHFPCGAHRPAGNTPSVRPMGQREADRSEELMRYYLFYY